MFYKNFLSLSILLFLSNCTNVNLIKDKLNINLTKRPEALCKEKYYEITEYYEKNINK